MGGAPPSDGSARYWLSTPVHAQVSGCGLAIHAWRYMELE